MNNEGSRAKNPWEECNVTSMSTIFGVSLRHVHERILEWVRKRWGSDRLVYLSQITEIFAALFIKLSAVILWRDHWACSATGF